MAEHVVKSDRTIRLVFILCMLVFVFAGAVIFLALHIYRMQMATLWLEAPGVAMRRFFNIYSAVFILVAISLVFGGFYILHFARRVYQSSQLPPPGEAVLFAKRVITGESARHRALVAMTLGLLLTAAGLVIPYYAFKLFRILAHLLV